MDRRGFIGLVVAVVVAPLALREKPPARIVFDEVLLDPGFVGERGPERIRWRRDGDGYVHQELVSRAHDGSVAVVPLMPPLKAG